MSFLTKQFVAYEQTTYVQKPQLLFDSSVVVIMQNVFRSVVRSLGGLTGKFSFRKLTKFSANCPADICYLASASAYYLRFLVLCSLSTSVVTKWSPIPASQHSTTCSNCPCRTKQTNQGQMNPSYLCRNRGTCASNSGKYLTYLWHKQPEYSTTFLATDRVDTVLLLAFFRYFQLVSNYGTVASFLIHSNSFLHITPICKHNRRILNY